MEFWRQRTACHPHPDADGLLSQTSPRLFFYSLAVISFTPRPSMLSAFFFPLLASTVSSNNDWCQHLKCNTNLGRLRDLRIATGHFFKIYFFSEAGWNTIPLMFEIEFQFSGSVRASLQLESLSYLNTQLWRAGSCVFHTFPACWWCSIQGPLPKFFSSRLLVNLVLTFFFPKIPKQYS